VVGTIAAGHVMGAGIASEGRIQRRRATLLDALLYATATAFAVYSVRSSPKVDYRAWAGLAWPAYALGVVVALALAGAASSLSARRVVRARAALATLVMGGALLIPLVAEVDWRATRGPAYAPSEVVLTEAAASRMLDGRDPYSTYYRSPELAGRNPSTARHFAYLPGTAILGVPHALWPGTRWTDARIPLALIVAIVVGCALRLWRASPATRLRALQVLVVLPTGAPLIVTGSGDIAVLGLCFLSLVALREAREVTSIVTATAAASLKLTAWPVLLAVLVTSRRLPGARHGRMALIPACALLAAIVGAGLVAAPGSFAADVVFFPLGLTTPASPARTPTLGSVLLAPLDGVPRLSPVRALVIAAFLAAALAVGVLLLLIASRAIGPQTPPASMAAAGAAAMLTALILLAPTGRSGYYVYPVDLVLLAMLMRPGVLAGAHQSPRVAL
jgi:hypothetical protein